MKSHKKTLLTADEERVLFSELYHINRFIFLTLLSHCSGCLKYAQEKLEMWKGQGNQETLLIAPPFPNAFEVPFLIDENALVFFQENHALRPVLSELLSIFQSANPEKNAINELLMKAWSEMEKREKIIIDNNENLVLSSIKKRAGKGSINEFDDLLAVGRMGLLRAIWKFNIFAINRNGTPSKFSTVAVPWVEQAIMQYRNENMNGAGVVLPDYLNSIWATLNQARTMLLTENGGNGNTSEAKLIKATLHLLKTEKPKIYAQYTPESLIAHLKNLLPLSPHAHFSELGRQHDDDNTGSPLEFIEFDPDISQNEHAQWLNEIIANLGEDSIIGIITPREWKIIKMRLGIGMNGYALRNFEIGELMNLRADLVQNEFRNAIKKIETHLKKSEKRKK